MEKYKHNKVCRICGNKDLFLFLDLGEQPLSNNFLKPEEVGKEDFFPLKVYYCQKCGLVQLLDVVNPEILFGNYAYFTGYSSQTMPIHFKELTQSLTNNLGLTEEDLVIDIGGNDGTFLKNFSCKTLNVEPAHNIASVSREAGIDTVEKFFSSDVAFDILQDHGKARVITASNVFAHVNNLYDFMSGVKCLLEDDGLFVVEVAHFLEQFKSGDFTQIYHEHLSYFLSNPLGYLAQIFGFNMRIDSIPIHGGSLRCFMRKKPFNLEDDQLGHNCSGLINTEEYFDGLYREETYQEFSQKVIENKFKLINLLGSLKVSGKRIIGYGAPAKGNTLLNYCGIGPETLDYLIDTTPEKQGKFSPGMHIPIVKPEIFYEDKPDYALLLAWNYQSEIFKKEEDFTKNRGKFIVPLPEPYIYPEE